MENVKKHSGQILIIVFSIAMALFSSRIVVFGNLGQFFDQNKTWLLIPIGCLFWLISKKGGNYKNPLFLLVISLFFSSYIAYLINQGATTQGSVAGTLPFQDANYFLTGAIGYLFGYPFNLRAGWKPIFPMYESSILYFTGINLQILLIVLGFFLMVSIFLAINQLDKQRKPLITAIFASLILVYSLEFVGVSTTEVLGILLGNTALVFFLLYFKDTSKERFWWLGLFFISLAEAVRIAALVILPVLIIGSGLFLDRKRKFSFKKLIIGAGIVILPFICVFLVGKIYNTVGNSAFNNFVYILYGQAKGGAGWTQFGIDNPGIDDPRVIFEFTWDFIKAHPLSLLIGFAKSFFELFNPKGSNLFSFMTRSSSVALNLINWALFFLCFSTAIIQAIKRIKDSKVQLFLMFCLIGIILSAPIAPPRDSGLMRVYASTMPFLFLFVSQAAEILPYSAQKEDIQSTKNISLPFFLFTALNSLMILLSPLLFGALTYLTNSQELHCPSNEVEMSFLYFPKVAINIIPDGALPEEHTLYRTYSNFSLNRPPQDTMPLADNVVSTVTGKQEPYTLTIAINSNTGEAFFLLFPQRMIPDTLENQKSLSGCMTLLSREAHNLYLLSEVTKN